MDKVPIATISKRLLVAEKECKPIEILTDEYPEMSLDNAYHVQLETVKSKQSQGNLVVGKKVGLTSAAMQKLLGVYEPDYGQLLQDMETSDGGEIRLSALIQPKVEAEVAFILRKDLKGPGITVRDVILATEAVAPALEVVDSRIKDWKIKIQDTVADNASSARFILGSKLTSLKELDLTLTGMVFKKNGCPINTAAGAAVLGNPTACVAWLVNKLAAYDITLHAGEVILSGAFSAAVEPSVGEYYEAQFDRLGSVGVQFIS